MQKRLSSSNVPQTPLRSGPLVCRGSFGGSQAKPRTDHQGSQQGGPIPTREPPCDILNIVSFFREGLPKRKLPVGPFRTRRQPCVAQSQSAAPRAPSSRTNPGAYRLSTTSVQVHMRQFFFPCRFITQRDSFLLGWFLPLTPHPGRIPQTFS